MKKLLKFAVALFVFLGITITLLAGPTIIRDKRIKDTALTPWLGRGYSMITNTFQSKCLGTIRITQPSYDFTYKFKSIETSSATTAGSSMKAGLGGSGAVTAASVTADVDVNLQTSMTTSTGESIHYHHILVEINMDTYYASVDEARTPMAESAAKLLTSNDIPGFFSSCGTYYVRSLGRNAKFISIFTYSDKSTQRDMAFEASLEAKIKGVAPVGGAVGGGGGGSITSGVASSLSQTMSEKKLMITTNAIGLGKNESASLVSYDIESFKKSIKEAFISMQDPNTGKVTTMEIVPWVENIEFQKLVKLEETYNDPDTGKPMLNYKKKHILNGNGEYLALIERADRNMMNTFYKAKICKQTIDASWAAEGKLLPAYAEVKIRNNKTPTKTMLLKDLYEKHLKEETISGLLDIEDKFMKEKGQKCIDKLLDSGMFKKSWRKIPECWNIRGEMSGVISETIDDYCMPAFAK